MNLGCVLDEKVRADFLLQAAVLLLDFFLMVLTFIIPYDPHTTAAVAPMPQSSHRGRAVQQDGASSSNDVDYDNAGVCVVLCVILLPHITHALLC